MKLQLVFPIWIVNRSQHKSGLFFNMDNSYGLDQESVQPKHVFISHEFADSDYAKQLF